MHDNLWTLLHKHTKVKRQRFTTNLQLAHNTHVPGAIVECGVWRGGMLAATATILPDRQTIGYDSFEGLPPAEQADGCNAHGQTAIDWQNTDGNPNCTAHIKHAHNAMTLAGITNYQLVKGWFADTLHTINYPDGIALLRLDGDWYSSTIQCLQALFPKVNPGGTIIIDDYWYWDGAAKALHQYLADHNRAERINQTGADPVCHLTKRDN